MRSSIYAVMSVLLIGLFAYFLNASTNLNLVFLRSKIPFQVIEEGQTVVNHFTLKLSHQGSADYKVEFSIAGEDKNQVQIVTNAHPTVLNVPEKKIVLFFKFSPALLDNGNKKIIVEAHDVETKLVLATKEVTLVGPTH